MVVAGARLTIECRRVLEDLTIGASIAVNGVCLTAVEVSERGFTADLAPETLDRSNLGDLRCGRRRESGTSDHAGGAAERAHRAGSRGWDGGARIVNALADGNWELLVRVPEALDRYLVYKGSIAIDGISLTIADITGSRGASGDHSAHVFGDEFIADGNLATA